MLQHFCDGTDVGALYYCTNLWTFFSTIFIAYRAFRLGRPGNSVEQSKPCFSNNVCNQSGARDQFLASRQRDNVINVIEPQAPEKNRKILRPRCLDGVATMNIVKMQ